MLVFTWCVLDIHFCAPRYELSLSVSDSVWQQTDIPANVTVLVKELDPAALSHAVPLTLYPASARQLTRHWTPKVGSAVGWRDPD